GNSHLDVPGSFKAIAEVTRSFEEINVITGDAAINQNRLHGYVGKNAGIVFEVRDVIGVETEKFKKPDRLSGAILGNTSSVGVRKLRPFEGAGVPTASTAAPGHRPDSRLRKCARRAYVWKRQYIIIQAADRQHRRLQVQRWLGIRREEIAVLFGM